VDWLRFGILDGGECVFDARFDPARGTLEQFFFHGLG